MGGNKSGKRDASRERGSTARTHRDDCTAPKRKKPLDNGFATQLNLHGTKCVLYAAKTGAGVAVLIGCSPDWFEAGEAQCETHTHTRTDNGANHFWDNDHVTEVGLDGGWLLAFFESLLGLSETLEETKRLASDTSDELSSCTAVHQLDELKKKQHVKKEERRRGGCQEKNGRDFFASDCKESAACASTRSRQPMRADPHRLAFVRSPLLHKRLHRARTWSVDSSRSLSRSIPR